MSSFYDRFILPRLIASACSNKAFARERAGLLSRAHGIVLEIGVGAWPNLAHYDPTRVEKVIGFEPSDELRRRAESVARASGLAYELYAEPAEHMHLPAQIADCAVLTFTLCSLPDPAAALRALHQALKPGGEVLFLEHGLAPDAPIARQQRFIEPVWKHLAGGCHLTRQSPALMRASGFEMGDLTQFYLPKAPKFASFLSKGWARVSA